MLYTNEIMSDSLDYRLRKKLVPPHKGHGRREKSGKAGVAEQKPLLAKTVRRTTTKSEQVYSSFEVRCIAKYIENIELAMTKTVLYNESEDLQQSMANLKDCLDQLHLYLVDDRVSAQPLTHQQADPTFKPEVLDKIKNGYH